MTQFTPSTPSTPTVPDLIYFEDGGDNKIAGYDLRLPLDRYKGDAVGQLILLGGGSPYWQSGTFGADPVRPGFRLHFTYLGVPSRIDVAALPVRVETPRKIDRSLAQAVYLLSLWLSAERQAWVYRPGTYPLVPFMLDSQGRTVTEVLIQTGGLPLLQSTND